MFLMFLCQNVRVYVKTRKMNVFVKPNEQCRACPNIVMARKRTFRGTRKERKRHAFIETLKVRATTGLKHSFRKGVLNFYC